MIPTDVAKRSDIEAVETKIDRLEMSLWDEMARRRKLKENLLGGAVAALLGVALTELFALVNARPLALVAFLVLLVIGVIYYWFVVMSSPKDLPKNKKKHTLPGGLEPGVFFPRFFELVVTKYPKHEFSIVFPAEFAEGAGSTTVQRRVGESAIECVIDVDLEKGEALVHYRQESTWKSCVDLINSAAKLSGAGSTDVGK